MSTGATGGYSIARREEGYSVHNDTDAEAELLVISTRLADPPSEKVDGFWP